MKTICVYCGSSPGTKPIYTQLAKQLGELLAREKITLVYGGGNIGLMGVIGDAVMAAGGKAIGVIPDFLAAKELAHPGLTQIHVVKSMHERKTMMASLADAFIAMPGGFGTFEELFEAITWTQLGLQKKPVGLLNVDRFYTKLIKFVEHATEEGFIRTPQSKLVIDAETPQELLTQPSNWVPPATEKWLSKKTT